MMCCVYPKFEQQVTVLCFIAQSYDFCTKVCKRQSEDGPSPHLVLNIVQYTGTLQPYIFCMYAGMC